METRPLCWPKMITKSLSCPLPVHPELVEGPSVHGSTGSPRADLVFSGQLCNRPLCGPGSFHCHPLFKPGAGSEPLYYFTPSTLHHFTPCSSQGQVPSHSIIRPRTLSTMSPRATLPCHPSGARGLKPLTALSFLGTRTRLLLQRKVPAPTPAYQYPKAASTRLLTAWMVPNPATSTSKPFLR